MPVELEDRGRALEDEYFHRREQELIEKMRAKLAAENTGAAPQQNCPKCDGSLVETNYENVKIDVCDKCHGVWLDSGELAQIMHKDENSSGDSSWFGNRKFRARSQYSN